MRTLVIKSWRLDPKPTDAQRLFVSITGREGGLLAWLLALVGVDPTTQIRVNPDRVEFQTASMAGTEFRMIPLSSVCSTYYGYYKPWKEALVIVLLFVGFALGLPSAQMGGIRLLLAAAGLLSGLVYYFLNRTLTLGFIENSGVTNGIRFKRSVIEQIDVNEAQARRVCVIVQQLIEARLARRVMAEAPTPTPPPPAASASSPTP